MKLITLRQQRGRHWTVAVQWCTLRNDQPFDMRATSLGKPLPIATIFLDGGGRIGMCRLPGLFGELDADVRAIAEWRPTLLVSMTEQSEMHQHGSEHLGAVLASAGIAWFHLPVRDYAGPEGDSRDAWPNLSARLHGILDDGGAILLHCRGGQGRSGMIALRLLVERGEEANVALGRLRSARPGAVETEVQLAWASGGATRICNPWR